MIDARQRKIDVVLFFDLSRLTRKGLSHAIGLLDEWQQAGVKPICYAYPMLDFTDDAGIGKVMAAMLAWMAEQERKTIVRRVKAGLAARKAKAGITEAGVPEPGCHSPRWCCGSINGEKPLHTQVMSAPAMFDARTRSRLVASESG